MDFRQVELFIAAAEEQHFTRAAKRANIVQSGLSVAIRSLEEELGTLLFIRSTRRVELSEAGRMFLPEARRIMLATKAARDAVAAVKGGLTGRLAVGTIQSLHPFLDLPLLLQEFHRRHPKVEIAVRESHPDDLMEALQKGRLHLGFMPLTGTPPSGLSVDRLFSSSMVVAVSPESPLGQRPSVKLSELREEAFVDFSVRWGTRQLVDQLFAYEDVVRRTEFEVENFDLLLQFVVRRLGIAVVPEALVDGRRLHHLRIESGRAGGVLPDWGIGLVRLKTEGVLSANPAADILQAMILRLAHATKEPAT